MVAAMSRGIFLYCGGVSNFSVPIQKIYKPYNPIMLMKRSDSNKLLTISQRRNGVKEYTINLKEVLKSFPRSRGNVISPRIYEVAYTVNIIRTKLFIPIRTEYKGDNSVFLKINDPAIEESETRIANGMKKFFLIRIS